jgi:HK97 family phage major capsid protein
VRSWPGARQWPQVRARPLTVLCRRSSKGLAVARRYINPNRPDARITRRMLDTYAEQHFSIAPGAVSPSDRAAALLAMRPPDRGAEGAARALDEFPWARSWGAFLSAIRDPGSDAAAIVSRVQQSVRPRAAMGERVGAEGGFLVPWRLLDQLQAYISQAIVRPRAMPVDMDALQVAVPVLDNVSQGSGAQALGGLQFELTAEASTIMPTVPNFGRLQLEARKFAGYLVGVPNELLQDGTAFTDSFLPRIIGEGYAWYEDDLFISQGTGVGEPQALINAPAAISVTRATAGAVSLIDLAGMMKALHPQAERGTATWIVADQVFSDLLELSLGVGSSPSATYVPASEWLRYDETSKCWRLLGLECVPHDHLPARGSTGDVVLADLSLFLAGTLAEMTVEVSSKGAGFGSDTSNVRIRSRIDGRFWPQSPFTTAAGATVSPLVILHS